MKVLVTGGGTGGHVYPALCVLNRLKEKVSEAEILYVGKAGSLEEKLATESGYSFRSIEARGLTRKISFDFFKSAVSNLKGFFQSLSILREFSPDVIFATGGYVAFPVLLAAVFLRRPFFLHEQNAVAGLTNRIFSRFAESVALSFPETRGIKSNRTKFTGNPVREEIFKARKEEAIEFFGLKEDLKTLLVMGGSQGSVKLNEALIKSLPAFARFRPIQIIHLTGEANFEEVKKEFEEKKEQLNFPDDLVYCPFPYLEEIGLAYAAADLVLCRAGATTISELMALGKPAILVPYPWATDNHQEENARAVERRGAGRVILEKDLTPIVLFEEVKRVIYNETALRLMGQRARWLSRKEADRAIVEIILSLKQASEILQSATEETEETEEWEWLTR